VNFFSARIRFKTSPTLFVGLVFQLFAPEPTLPADSRFLLKNLNLLRGFSLRRKLMNRGLKLYDKFLAGSGKYTSVEAAEMTGRCLQFMTKNRRKYRFTEKMIIQEEKRLKRFINLVKKKPKKPAAGYKLRIAND
jgi:hypothetical protein